MFTSDILNSKWFVFCLLALVVFAVFGRAIWFDYVQLDEGVLLINNGFFISDISNIFEIFKHDVNYPSAVAPFYRPVFTLSLILNSQFGISSAAYHTGNLLLHLVATLTLFWLFRELGNSRNLSLAFSMLFAVHPIATSIVAWIPGRNDSILAIFTLLSFILFIRFLKNGSWRYLLGLFVAFAAALLAKEVAVGLIPVFVFYYLMSRKEKGSELVATLFSGLIAILVVWFWIRESIINSARVAELSFVQILSVLWSNSASAILYLGKTILPFNLTVFPTLDGSTFVYGFVALAVMILFWIFSRTKIMSLSALGILWFVVFLIPSLISYDQAERMVFFEHRLYLPLVGIFIFLADSISTSASKRFDIWKYQSKLIMGLIIFLSAVLAFNYSGAYKNKAVFWQKAVADSPQASRAHSGLAVVYIMEGKMEEAEAEFNKALELNPREKRIHLLLGLSYLDQNLYDKAREEFEKEIEIDPNQFVAYHGLGRLYARGKNLKEAERYFLKTLEINPNYVLAHQDLVVLYFSQNKHPQAIAQLKELLKLQRPEAMHPQIKKIIETYAKETVLRQ